RMRRVRTFVSWWRSGRRWKRLWRGGRVQGASARNLIRFAHPPLKPRGTKKTYRLPKKASGRRRHQGRRPPSPPLHLLDSKRRNAETVAQPWLFWVVADG